MHTLCILRHPHLLLWELIMCMQPIKKNHGTSCQPNDVVQIPSQEKQTKGIIIKLKF